MTNEELREKVRELKEIKRMVEELEKETTTIQDEIKAEMTTRGVTEMLVDIFKIRWTPYTTTRFDTALFKKHHKKLYEQYSDKVETKRFTID